MISIPVQLPRKWARGGVRSFPAQPVFANKATRFGGNAEYVLPGDLQYDPAGPDYLTLPGRGCVNSRPGFGTTAACAYNGSRWFAGPSAANNETQEDPMACHTGNAAACRCLASTMRGRCLG